VTQPRHVHRSPLRTRLWKLHGFSRYRILPSRVCLRSTSNELLALLMPCNLSTYVVNDSIPLYYYTEVIGDARKPPTILAAANFNPAALAIFGELPLSKGNEKETLGSLCEQMLIHTFLMETEISGTLTRTTCKRHLPFERARLLIGREVSVPSRICGSTPLWSHPKLCMCFEMIGPEPGTMFTQIAGLHASTGKSPKRPPCTTSSSNYQPPMAPSIVPSRWRMEGGQTSSHLELP